ncbi:cytochrome P450 [Nannocystis pusilla]|uniref:Cytochrome P450 n=1 Tax=Nannocystis pusilla TaxID=889268 RepID=A0ABS7U0P7_9BACT|nr:cytochrome P450 [Nannocystis pusilla]MBZ5714048.1 cytochrome P450 [Nannocystis pusilla]
MEAPAEATETPFRTLPRAPGLPWLGSMVDIARKTNYVGMTELVRRYGAPLGVHFGNIVVVPTVRPEHAQHILVESRGVYQKLNEIDGLRLLVGQGLFSSEGETWTSQRRLMQPHFTPKAVQRYVADMRGAVEQMLQRWSGQAEVEALFESMRMAMDVIGRTMFGVPEIGEAGPIGRAIGTALELASRRLFELFTPPLWIPTPQNRRFVAAKREVDAFIYDLIGKRRAGTSGSEQRDLLDVLIAATDDESGRRMSDEQLRDEVMTVFIAGHETTAVTLTWALALLARHPEVMARVQAEVDALGHDIPGLEDIPKLPYTRQVIDETLRLYPAVWAIPRTAARDDVLCGYPIAKGSIVTVMVHELHRQPDVWPDPNRFDPGRFAAGAAQGRQKSAYMPFGAGHRICIGIHFALLELVVALAAVARRYSWRLVAPEVPAVGVSTLRPARPVRIALAPRRADAR